MKRRELLKSGLAIGAITTLSMGGVAIGEPRADDASDVPPRADDRSYWLAQLDRVCHPLLDALSQRRLKTVMPLEAFPGRTNTRDTTYLEALGRGLAGIAP